MTILITGATGYIGSHMCAALLENKYQVVGLDNLSNSNLETAEIIKTFSEDRFNFYKGDILDLKLLDSIFNRYKIDCVIHFAGLKSVEESTKDPFNYYNNNINGSLNLISSMIKNKVKNIIFSSSATVYGTPNYLPVDEEHNINPINPYGKTKAYIEEILKDLAKSDMGWSVTCLRYFNPVGAHHSGLLGEMPNETPSNLMPYVSMVAGGEKEHLNIYGDDYNTPDGTGIRDYIHVMDLVDGHLSALIYNLSNKESHNVFNLGTGTGYSVKEIVKIYEKISSKKIKTKVIGRRGGDVPSCYAKVSKANNLLGWSAKRTIEEMCQSAWEFKTKE
jgi:UDP-glucose 4-epimerase